MGDLFLVILGCGPLIFWFYIIIGVEYFLFSWCTSVALRRRKSIVYKVPFLMILALAGSLQGKTVMMLPPLWSRVGCVAAGPWCTDASHEDLGAVGGSNHPSFGTKCVTNLRSPRSSVFT